MNATLKTVVFWLVIVVSAALLWQVVRSGSRNAPAGQVSEISYSRFLAHVADGQVSSVTISGNVVRGIDAKGAMFRVVVPSNQTAMMDALQQRGVEIWFREAQEQNWPSWILNLAPLVLLGALWFFMIRQMQARRSGGSGPPAYTPTPDSKPRFGS